MSGASANARVEAAEAQRLEELERTTRAYALLVLLSVLWLWVRRARLRILDRRMAHLRERLR